MDDNYVVYKWMNSKLGLTQGTRDLFAVMYTWCNRHSTDKYTNGTKYLQELTGISPRGITKCMTKLLSTGFVSYEFHGRKGTIYTIDEDLVQQKINT